MIGNPASTPIAALDLGSNSVRLAVFLVDAAGGFQEAENIKRTLRLGGRLDAAGRLGPEAVAELLTCVRHFRHVAEAWNVTETLAVATAVFRAATNGAEVVARCAEALGSPLRLLSGEEEAALGFASVFNSMSYPDALVVDLGGASIELTSMRDRQVVACTSVPLGAVTLTDRFVGPGGAGREALLTTLTAVFGSHPWIAQARGPLIAIGGTARSIARLHQGRRRAQLMGEHHHVVPPMDLLALEHQVVALDLEARCELPGLARDRAELIEAGFAVFRLLAAGTRPMIVSSTGLREGLLYERLAPARGLVVPEAMPRADAERWVSAWGLDGDHARHVRLLALGLLASLGQPDFPGAGMILEVAALLRGLGRLIGFHGFETHTFYGVLHTPLAGLTSAERAAVAVVASYRSARQLKQQLEHLPMLPGASERDLERLGAILLVAEGLDRTRLQVVASARLVAAGSELEVVCRAAGPDLLEYAMLDEPLGRLAKAFKRKVTLHVEREEPVHDHR